MSKLLALFLGTFVAFLLAPSASGQQPDTLSAILAEIRQLRASVERAATINPHVQVTIYRLNTYQERITRLSGQVQQTQDMLRRVSASLQGGERGLKRLEEALVREIDPQKRQAMEREQAATKSRMEAQASEEQALRTREAELTNQLHTEQLRWDGLNAKLDEMLRMMGQG